MHRKKLLITGAGGFIGSHVVEHAVRAGYEVRAFVHYNSNGRAGWLDESEFLGSVELHRGDIRDMDMVETVVRGCDTVFHLAALIGIPYSYVSPAAYLRTNIEGTYNVLEAARKFDVSNVLITSTSETYGTAQYTPIDEKHPANAQSPYAATKVAADQLALSYWRSFGTPVKIVRPFNTYGPRQSTRAIIPTVISQLIAGSRNLSLGALDPTRDLTFVTDTARAFFAVADCPECTGTATNAGCNEEISVGDLAHLIARIMGVEVNIEADTARIRPGASEVMRLRCDNSRLKSLTRWEPEYNLKRGLERTIEWFRQRNVSGSAATVYNI